MKENTLVSAVTSEAVIAALVARGEAPNQALVQTVVTAAANMDRVIARLLKASDAILDDLLEHAEGMPQEQMQAATSVLGTVLEHTEALMLMRHSVATTLIEAHDVEVDALVKVGAAVADEILLTEAKV